MLGYQKQCRYDSITIPQFISHCRLQDPCRGGLSEIASCGFRFIKDRSVGRLESRLRSDLVDPPTRLCECVSIASLCEHRVTVPDEPGLIPMKPLSATCENPCHIHWYSGRLSRMERSILRATLYDADKLARARNRREASWVLGLFTVF